MDPFEVSLLSHIKREHLLEDGQCLVVGLSGGPDSVALTRALKSLSDRLHLSLFAAHVNHGLRGQESNMDQSFVEQLCGDLRIQLFVKVISSSQYGPGNLENQARLLRMEFLQRTALEQRGVVATAHNLRDQAETVLLRLFRGSGPAGLGAIRPRRILKTQTGQPVLFIRPLLTTSHQAILDYLVRIGQDCCFDSSNDDLGYQRNWVRHNLLPLIENRFGPGLSSRLSRCAQLMQGAAAVLDQESRHAYARLTGTEGSLEIAKLQALPVYLRMSVLRLALEDLSSRSFDLRHIDQVLSLLEKQSGKTVHLPGKLQARREFGSIRITKGGHLTDWAHSLKIPGRTAIVEVGKEMTVAKHLDAPDLRILLPKGTVARSWKPGDRYRELGSNRAKKLRDLFQRRRVPKSERHARIILSVDDQLIWVEGFQPNPHFVPQQPDQGWDVSIGRSANDAARTANGSDLPRK